MAAHRKLDALASLHPDVAILPECANPSTLMAKYGANELNMAWVGHNPNKGLGILAFGDYSVELLPEYDEPLEWIAPTSVTGPFSFMLLGAWCMNHRASQQHPWEPPRRQVEPALVVYRDLIRLGATVVAGDLNNNVTWGRPGRIDNFTATAAAAEPLGWSAPTTHTMTWRLVPSRSRRCTGRRARSRGASITLTSASSLARGYRTSRPSRSATSPPGWVPVSAIMSHLLSRCRCRTEPDPPAKLRRDHSQPGNERVRGGNRKLVQRLAIA
jgi:hypothetical protein